MGCVLSGPAESAVIALQVITATSEISITDLVEGALKVYSKVHVDVSV